MENYLFIWYNLKKQTLILWWEKIKVKLWEDLLSMMVEDEEERKLWEYSLHIEKDFATEEKIRYITDKQFYDLHKYVGKWITKIPLKWLFSDLEQHFPKVIEWV